MDKIVNIVASPIIHKNKFLFIKRVKPPYRGLWSMIGGKLEFGEDLQEAMLREVQEETGMRVKFVAIRGIVIEHLRVKKKISKHFIIWICETRAIHDMAVEQDEGEVKWFTKAEMRKNKKLFLPSDFQMTEDFFLRKKKNLPVHKSKMVARGQTYELEYFGV